MIIHTKNTQKSFGKITVLKGIDLEIQKGEIVSIVGASGAGKTTLLQILGTLETPDIISDSFLFIDGTDPSVLSDKKRSEFRNKNIGFIFQFHQLLPEFTALENVCLPAFIAKTPRKIAEKKAVELLTFLDLAHRLHQKPSTLSGGEQQRVAVARALINSPKIIFADEPSGNLDTKSAEKLHQLFFDLRAEFGYTFVIITHNEILADLSDRKLTLKDGKLIS